MARALLALLVSWLATAPSAAPRGPAAPAQARVGAPASDEALETLREGAPGGGRIERQVRRGEGGAPIAHGEYRRWNAAGRLVEEGRFADGQKVGRWETWYANGERRSEESWRRGRRNGESRTWREDGSFERKTVYEAQFEYYEDGSLRSDGECMVLGRAIRHGNWAWYRPGGAVFCTGEFERGEPTGSWTWFGWDGAVLCTGAYERVRVERQFVGRPAGDWLFHHPDGTPDPGFLSASYADGVRGPYVGPARLEDPPRDPPPAQQPVPSLPNPASWPTLDAEAEQELVRALLLKCVGDESARAEAGEALVAAGPSVLPTVLATARALDLDDPEVRAVLGEAWTLLPPGVLGGRLAEWRVGDTGESAADFDRLQVRRWLTLWEWCRPEPEERLALAAGPAPALQDALLGTELGELGAWNTAPAGDVRRHGPIVDPTVVLREREELGPSGTEGRLEKAAAWLCRQQAPDGSWHGDLQATCYALIALAGLETAGDDGPIGRAVERGMGWLLGREEPTTRHPEESRAPDPEAGWVAIALAESAHRVRDPKLRREIQSYFNGLIRARKGHAEEGVPEDHATHPVGPAWEALALAIGQRAGFRVLSRHMDWTPRWLRVAESRVAPDDAETRALLLFCRRLLGADPEDERVVHAAGELDRARADVAGSGAEGLATLCFGAYGLEWIGGEAWRAWNVALKDALARLQGEDGGLGADDAAGVRSTALGALALQVYGRFPWYGE